MEDKAKPYPPESSPQNSNVVFGGKPDAVLVALDEMKRNMSNMTEYQEMYARLLWTKFNALKKAGFNEKQALELVGKGLF